MVISDMNVFLTSIATATVTAFAAAAVPLQAHAEGLESQQGTAKDSSWSVGAGVGLKRSPYAGAENEAKVLPFLQYESARIRLSGTTLDWKLGTAGPLSFTLRSRYGLSSGYEADDSPHLTGMSERKDGFWLGARLNWNTEVAKFSAEALGATGASKGAHAKLGMERDFRHAKFVFTPRASLAWYDRKYVDYYYGVTPAEATDARPAYRGESAINLELGLRSAYVVDRHSTVFIDMSATSLGSNIKNSPLVDKKLLPAVAIGYLYRF